MEVGLKAANHPVVAGEHRIRYPDIHHLDATLVVGRTAIHIGPLVKSHQQVAHACDFEVPDSVREPIAVEQAWTEGMEDHRWRGVFNDRATNA